jgi:hypothetical protein
MEEAAAVVEAMDAEMVMDEEVAMITMVTPVESGLDLVEAAASVGSIKDELPFAKQRGDL